MYSRLASNGLGIIGTIICGIIAFSLFLVGYQERAAWNTDLVKTRCEYTSHEAVLTSCSEDCCEQSCIPVYHIGSDGTLYTTQSCSYECGMCNYNCWPTSCTFRYRIRSTGEYNTKKEKKNMQDSEKLAQNYLNSECPIGGSWICYYHGSDTSNVVNSQYNTTAWLVVSIIFMAFTGMGFVWILFTGIMTIRVAMNRRPSLQSGDREMVQPRHKRRRQRRTLIQDV